MSPSPITSRALALGSTLVLGLLLASSDVHAQGAAPAPAPTYQPPQYVPNTYGTPPGATPGSAVAPPRAELLRPRSIEEFKSLRRELREDISDARGDDRDAEVERLKDDLRTVDRWYDEDTERRSGGAFAGGIVMVSVGGLSAVVGLLVVAFAGVGEAFGNDTDEEQVAGAVTIITGLGMVGGGIPLMIYGSKRVMVSENALAPIAPPAPRTAVVLGPGSLRLEGSF